MCTPLCLRLTLQTVHYHHHHHQTVAVYIALLVFHVLQDQLFL